MHPMVSCAHHKVQHQGAKTAANCFCHSKERFSSGVAFGPSGQGFGDVGVKIGYRVGQSYRILGISRNKLVPFSYRCLLN